VGSPLIAANGDLTPFGVPHHEGAAEVSGVGPAGIEPATEGL